MKKFFVMAIIGAFVVPFMAGCGDDNNNGNGGGGGGDEEKAETGNVKWVSCSGETMCSCEGNGTKCLMGRWIKCENDEAVEVVPNSPKCK